MGSRYSREKLADFVRFHTDPIRFSKMCSGDSATIAGIFGGIEKLPGKTEPRSATVVKKILEILQNKRERCSGEGKGDPIKDLE